MESLHANDIANKEADRQYHARNVEAFLASGGTIRQVERGESGDPTRPACAVMRHVRSTPEEIQERRMRGLKKLNAQRKKSAKEKS